SSTSSSSSSSKLSTPPASPRGHTPSSSSSPPSSSSSSAAAADDFKAAGEDVPRRRWTSRPKLKSLNDIEQKYHSMGHRQQLQQRGPSAKDLDVTVSSDASSCVSLS